MNRDVVVVHPGVQHSGELAASLNRAGRLAFLATRLQVGSDPRWPWSLRALEKRIPRRIAPGLVDARIERIGAFEEALLRSAGAKLPARQYRTLDRLSTQRFIDAAVARLTPAVRVVVGTDTASLELFRRLAVERPDIGRVLDVSHPVDLTVQPLIRDDAESWGLDLGDYDDFHPGPPIDQRAEIESADVVLVASQFSESTFKPLNLSEGRIHRVPYAVAPSLIQRVEPEPGAPLRLLALGAMSERKGMSVLLRAMGALERQRVAVRLVIAGRESGGYRLPVDLPSNTSYAGAPTAAGVAGLFAESDALVLPSMCEGFGRTLLEALAAGLAVVTTERSGGPDVLREAPTAPVTIVPAERRDTLAAVLADHSARREQFIRPSDSRNAAACFSDSHYLGRMQDAMSAAMRLAEARVGMSHDA